MNERDYRLCRVCGIAPAIQWIGRWNKIDDDYEVEFELELCEVCREVTLEFYRKKFSKDENWDQERID
jgi:hypothetical protein